MSYARSSNITPSEYAHRVQEHAKSAITESLYSGQGYRGLSDFLNKAHSSPTEHDQRTGFNPRYTSKEKFQDESFAILYELEHERINSIVPLNRNASIRDIGSNLLLILRGYPSGHWLCSLGASYNIDPEFFYRHLDFMIPGLRRRERNPFMLPSFQTTMFQLPLTSLGVRTAPRDPTSWSIESKSDEMDKYLHDLSTGHGWKCGNSIVRAFESYGDDIFTIKQKVSVYVGPTKADFDKWIVIMWFDCGDDLSKSPNGPWYETAQSRLHTYFRPTIMFRPAVSLKDHKVPASGNASDSSADTTELFPQSTNLLSSSYGRSLNTATMSIDPFYVMNELFAFVAAAEVANLNMVSLQLHGIEIDHLEPDSIAIVQAQAKLLHYRRTLEDQAQDIAEVLTVIQNRTHFRWPQSQSRKAQLAAERVELDFRYLYERNKLMQKKCERELTTIMNSANIAEARSGIAQNKRVLKLTLLAFGFVPLTFSSSLFGMNFVQFSRLPTGYWVYALVSATMLAISVTTLLWDGTRSSSTKPSTV